MTSLSEVLHSHAVARHDAEMCVTSVLSKFNKSEFNYGDMRALNKYMSIISHSNFILFYERYLEEGGSPHDMISVARTLSLTSSMNTSTNGTHNSVTTLPSITNINRTHNSSSTTTITSTFPAPNSTNTSSIASSITNINRGHNSSTTITSTSPTPNTNHTYNNNNSTTTSLNTQICDNTNNTNNTNNNTNNFTIVERRTIIYDHILSMMGGICNPNQLCISDIQLIYDEYNNMFFYGSLPKISFELSRKMTKSGGIYTEKNGEKKIKISVPIVLGCFGSGETKLSANGINVYNRIEALQQIIEHEIIHLYIYTNNTAKRNEHHGETFKKMAKETFGHTECTHKLIGTSNNTYVINNSSGDNNDKKYTYTTGQIVSFTLKGHTVKAQIMKLNPKRARVELLDTRQRYDVSYNIIT